MENSEKNIINDSVNEVINVEMSKDKMLGVIWFNAPKNGGQTLSYEKMMDILKGHGIVAGINEKDLQELSKEKKYEYKYIIAKGKPAVNGEAAKINLQFDAEALKNFKPTTNEDGTVDFKNLNIVHNVKKGEILATKVLPTMGEDGYNVAGQPLKAKKGKDIRMPKGKNTVLSEDGLTLMAAQEGKLEYDGYNVSVSNVYLISGDVDSGTGNIEFVGDIVVGGSVHSGFKIKAQGSVEVRGPVDSATIIAGKDIILSYGVQGTETSKLIAGGNIIAKFIQNTNVEAEGDIVTEAIMHSNVTAGGAIKVENGKGTIVGGSVAATNLVMARSIGSPMGTVTSIQIGVAPSVYAEHKQLIDEIKKQEENIKHIDQSMAFIRSKFIGGNIPPDKEEMLRKLSATRQPLYAQLQQDRTKFTKLSKKLNEANDGLIRVSGNVYPGVKIVFGSLIKYIDDVQVRCSIRKVDGDIYIGV